ncbi:MAG: molecular chaperone HtpG [Bauldia sp.]
MSDADAAAGAATQPFTAEVSRLLHLMVHSVYSNRDIFLRELISNGADACERLRLLALDDPALLVDDAAFRIRLEADPAARTLVIDDNGVGMDRAALVDNLGTIARSGTRAFLDSTTVKDGSALIGQFGVGFYSAFMVADRVDVLSRPAGRDEAWRWSSDGKGAFTVEAIPVSEAPARGTRVVLHLTEDAKEYAEQGTLERIVTEHSAHVPVPIVLALSADTTRTLADGSALWRKPKAEIEKSAYAEFYHHVGGQFDEPAVTLHYRAEGRQDYSALLFVPSEKPFDLFDPERKSRIRLYVRRVFITSEAQILPPWLRFVRGVVDSDDLPLNLSREMLQKNPLLAQIGKGVTNRLLSEIERLAKDDPERFRKLWEAFGPVLKEGLYEDPERRDMLFGIARFRTTNSGDSWRSLKDYVADLKPNQTAIYYALGESREAIAGSPHLEGFRKRGIEVLVLSDPVDAFWVRTALGFDGKPFKSVTQGAADLSAIPAEGSSDTPADQPAPAVVATLAARIKEALGDRVSAVRASERLTESAVCLVAPDLGPDRQLERILKGQDGAPKRAAPVLEINPGHPLIKALVAKTDEGAADVIDDAAFVLFGQAMILDGETPDDPADFARRVGGLLEASLR